MARFPDLGSWFMRSVRRDHFASTPVLAVERLNSLPRPIQDADKEVLVGAVLTMSSSLHLALSMLRELLPHEKSQERLAEVVSSEPKRPGLASDEQPVQVRRHGDDRSCSSCGSTNTKRLLPLQDNDQARQLHIEVGSHNRPETHLVKALQAEMRVQAAIHVAIESLEFAEGQLKVVKEVNQLHGGELDILQTHFYEDKKVLAQETPDRLSDDAFPWLKSWPWPATTRRAAIKRRLRKEQALEANILTLRSRAMMLGV
ncbi:e6582913-073a-46b3-9535-54928cbc4f08 [Thermothielavioides terrestris]|uniref:E6582913-073a-46b3-9535-54928cbc4f08 n=1 Tax=Thermothielavioides terrestris TaxID=2587410 RepID=A0A446BRI2_9PEZI|nr:e6582913-073a-46b3-9535-54928cbc4f08 [Thermothielavioides terrestris]